MPDIKICPLLLAVLITISACVSGPPKLYAELWLEWQCDRCSDWMLQPEREWNGDSPFLRGEIGFEFDYNIQCGIWSDTSLFTGAPFKEKSPDDPQQELHQVKAGCGGRWGGK